MTRGLGIVPDATSDNLTPQETTNQPDIEVGTDGAELSCPGSSAVADSEGGEPIPENAGPEKELKLKGDKEG